MALSSNEIYRKLLHILSGTLIPGGIFYLPLLLSTSPLLPASILGIITVCMFIIEFLRRNDSSLQKFFLGAFATMMREDEKKNMTGATYIFLSAFLCTVLFYKAPHISLMVLSTFIIGDAAAALVGLSIGKIKIGKKSLEGSIACFTVCLLLFQFVFPHLPFLLNSWNGKIPFLLSVIASLCVTLFELFPLQISKRIVLNDNLTVPILTGVVISLLQPLFV